MNEREIIAMLQLQIESLQGQRNHFAYEAGKKIVHHWRCCLCALKAYCETSPCPGFVSLTQINKLEGCMENVNYL